MIPTLNTTGGLMPARGYDGQLSRTTESIVDSLVNSGATRISFGQCVGRDPDQPLCLRLALVGDELLGPVVRDPVTYHADSDGNVGFSRYVSTPFLRHGYMNLTPAENVRAGDGLVAIFTEGVFSGWGGTTNGLSETRRLVKGFKWETNTSANAAEPGEVSGLGTNAVNYVIYA